MMITDNNNDKNDKNNKTLNNNIKKDKFVGHVIDN